MKQQMDLELFDQRILEQRLRHGAISKKDYEKFLKSLPESKDNIDYIEVFEEEPKSEEGSNSSRLTFAPVDTGE